MIDSIFKSLDRASDFPALKQKIHGKNLVYLDSAATSLKPHSVIERIHEFNTNEIANVHRGAHYLADKATEAFEQARANCANFIGANSKDEIIFVRGTTEGLNLIAHSLLHLLKTGYTSTYSSPSNKTDNIPEILLTEMEHHSNIVPWQLKSQELGYNIRCIKVNSSGELDSSSLDLELSRAPKVLAITHCSNHVATINPLKEIIKKAHQVGTIVVVDGAQMVGKHPIKVQELDADFYIFSGHKMFAPFGIGAVYGRLNLLEAMAPYQGGGSMISEVHIEQSTYLKAPFKFEAGTPNVEGAIALSTAIDYINDIGFKTIEQHENNLKNYAYEKLSALKSIQLLGPTDLTKRSAVFAFNLKSLHHADVAQILDQQGIAVRAGHHCTQPLIRALGITGSLRASLSIYNKSTDIDQLIDGLKKAEEILT